MRVRIITTTTFPDGMAATSRIKCYAKALQESGLKVDIVAANGSVSNPDRRFLYKNSNTGIPYVALLNKSLLSNRWLKYAWSSISGYLLALHTLFTMHNFDICFIYMTSAWPNVLLLPFLKLAGKKTVYELNEFPYATEGNKITRYRWVKNYLRWVTFHVVFPMLDGVIAISDRLISVAQKRAKRAKVIKVPILTESMPAESDVNRNGNSKSNPYLFHAGSLSEQKDGIVKMFEAFAEAHQKLAEKYGVRLSFYVTSKMTQPATWEKIKTVIDNNELNDYVHITGFLSDEELEKYQRNALALVINKPDTFQNQYNFPTKLSTYLASGTPVIVAAKNLELNEYLKHGLNAFIVPPNDYKAISKHIITCYEDANMAKDISRNALETVKNIFFYKCQSDVLYNVFYQIYNKS